MLSVTSAFFVGMAAGYSDQRRAYLPLMLHPDPKTALFLGPGTGTTFSAAAGYPDLRVDGVELIPELLPLMDYFTPPGENAAGAGRRRVFAADARRFVLARHQAYDVIVADLFHPSRDGAGFLYTREHFGAIRSCLSESRWPSNC